MFNDKTVAVAERQHRKTILITTINKLLRWFRNFIGRWRQLPKLRLGFPWKRVPIAKASKSLPG